MTRSRERPPLERGRLHIRLRELVALEEQGHTIEASECVGEATAASRTAVVIGRDRLQVFLSLFRLLTSWEPNPTPVTTMRGVLDAALESNGPTLSAKDTGPSAVTRHGEILDVVFSASPAGTDQLS
jgi:hypothetical protein